MIFLDVDPNIVKPGWTPLIITILMAAAITLLMISMRRHMRRINAPYRDDVAEQQGGTAVKPADRAGDEPSDRDIAGSDIAGSDTAGDEPADTDRPATAGSAAAAGGSATKADQTS